MDARTFNPGDVRNSFRVEYKVGQRIDRRTFYAYVLRNDSQKWYDVTIQLYDDENEAQYVYSITTSPQAGSSIIRAQWLDLPEGGYPTIIFEKFHCCTFETWLSKQTNVWKRNKDGVVVSAGKHFTRAFKGIISGIQALHYDEKYHGRLMDGIRISNDNLVQLVDFSRKATFEEGMKQDLNDIQQLVERVCVQDSSANDWVALQLFQELRNVFSRQPNGLSLNGLLTTYGFFVYNSTLFYDDKDRCKLVEKMLEFQKLNAKTFHERVTLDRGLTEISEWQPIASEHNNFKIVFYHDADEEDADEEDGNSSHYKTKASILKFFKNCQKHLVGQSRKTADDVQEDLHDTFPDVIHKLFYNFVEGIGVEPTFVGHEVIPLFRVGAAGFY